LATLIVALQENM